MLYHFRKHLRGGEAHECKDMPDLDSARAFAAEWGSKYTPGDVRISVVDFRAIHESEDGLRGPGTAGTNHLTTERVVASVWA